ncbi:hypothetical protein AMTR_s00140p00102290 [Amborella trichopoda]|uniref:Uncharacterized protein n=1 Tax=Amborella trichopoda TaxID=13333 RepID=W1PB25_AMBTC|nr:hypothetical protein AMTR_s00140p00102290 [Amborella trichopoda]
MKYIVPRVNEALEHIGLGISGKFATGNDSSKDLAQALAGPFTTSVGRDGEVGEEDRDGDHAIVEFVQERCDIASDLVTRLSTQEAPTRS